ncbi:MAG: SDR family oxidoreductase [Mycobacteriaceae bacterium]
MNNINNKNKFRGCVAITGGAKGIGAATALAFAQAGASVSIGDIDEKLAQELAAKIGGGARGYFLDVTDPESFQTYLDKTQSDLGSVDVFINNAAIMFTGAFDQQTPESISRQVSVNISGVITGTHIVIKQMLLRGKGCIVNVASAAGKIGEPGAAVYSSTKFAVVGLTEALRMEYRSSGIKFTCVMPGLVETDLTSGIDNTTVVKARQPEDVAREIVRGVIKQRDEVFVPQLVGVLSKVNSLLPKKLSMYFLRKMGVDRLMLDSAHSPGRIDYETRISDY